MFSRWLFKRPNAGAKTGTETGRAQDQPAATPLSRPQDHERSKAAAPLSDFVAWLIQAGEVYGLKRRTLWILYQEFCEYTDTPPLTEHQLLRRVQAAGIERYRESTGRRPWRYRVRSAVVVQLHQVEGA